MPLKVSEGENLETGEKQPLAKLRFAQFRTQSNKTYRTSSHGLGSPKTRLRDRGVAGVRRNPGGGVRNNRNFISASPSPPSPKSQISVYLPICFLRPFSDFSCYMYIQCFEFQLSCPAVTITALLKRLSRYARTTRDQRCRNISFLLLVVFTQINVKSRVCLWFGVLS